MAKCRSGSSKKHPNPKCGCLGGGHAEDLPQRPGELARADPHRVRAVLRGEGRIRRNSLPAEREPGGAEQAERHAAAAVREAAERGARQEQNPHPELHPGAALNPLSLCGCSTD